MAHYSRSAAPKLPTPNQARATQTRRSRARIADQACRCRSSSSPSRHAGEQTTTAKTKRNKATAQRQSSPPYTEHAARSNATPAPTSTQEHQPINHNASTRPLRLRERSVFLADGAEPHHNAPTTTRQPQHANHHSINKPATTTQPPVTPQQPPRSLRLRERSLCRSDGAAGGGARWDARCGPGVSRVEK